MKPNSEEALFRAANNWNPARPVLPSWIKPAAAPQSCALVSRPGSPIYHPEGVHRCGAPARVNDPG
jgi:hypothetical protein